MVRLTKSLLVIFLILGISTWAMPMDPPAPIDQAQSSQSSIKDRLQKLKFGKAPRPIVQVPQQVKDELRAKVEAFRVQKAAFITANENYEAALKAFQDHYIAVDKLRTKKAQLMNVMRNSMDEHDMARLAQIDNEIAAIKEKANTELKATVNEAFNAVEVQRKAVKQLEEEFLEIAKKPEVRELLLQDSWTKEAMKNRVKKTMQPNFERNMNGKIHRIGQAMIRPL